MARRYWAGTALPDYKTIILLAETLNTTPSWLLFGSDAHVSNALEMNKEVLLFCFKHIVPQMAQRDNLDAEVSQLSDAIEELTKLNLTSAQMMQSLAIIFRIKDHKSNNM